MRNLFRFSSLDTSEVIACFTCNAAESIGISDRGAIRPGKRADIVVVDDEWNVQMTIVGGRIVYRREDEDEDEDAPGAV
jgi:N-acetylglucosamine-6-phosphate deacetylase